MSTVWWPDGKARLKTYSSSSRAGGRAVIKFEIEIIDNYYLGQILSDLAAMMREQKVADQARAREAATAAREAARPKRAPRTGVSLPNSPLLLPYHREDDDG